MKDFIEILKEELERQNKLIERINKNMKNFPDGTLKIRYNKNKYIQYYLKRNNKQTYINSGSMDNVNALAQKAYESDLHKMACRRAKTLEALIRDYDNSSVLKQYEDLDSLRKSLVSPLVLPDDEYIKKWLEDNPEGKNPYPIDTGFLTDNGKLVRSKSEKIFADMLNKKGVIYVYEPELILDDGSRIYPDFMVLNIKLRKVYVHEHFGMMDDADYSAKVLDKLMKYQNKGYWIGENLITTFEHSACPFNIKTAETIIDRYYL